MRLYERYAESLPERSCTRGGPRPPLARSAHLLGPRDPECIAKSFAPDIEFRDQRALVELGDLTWQRKRSSAACASRSKPFAMLRFRVDDVLALRSDALLCQCTISGIDRKSGGAYELQLVYVVTFGGRRPRDAPRAGTTSSAPRTRSRSSTRFRTSSTRRATAAIVTRDAMRRPQRRHRVVHRARLRRRRHSPTPRCARSIASTTRGRRAIGTASPRSTPPVTVAATAARWPGSSSTGSSSSRPIAPPSISPYRSTTVSCWRRAGIGWCFSASCTGAAAATSARSRPNGSRSTRWTSAAPTSPASCSTRMISMPSYAELDARYVAGDGQPYALLLANMGAFRKASAERDWTTVARLLAQRLRRWSATVVWSELVTPLGRDEYLAHTRCRRQSRGARRPPLRSPAPALRTCRREP